MQYSDLVVLSEGVHPNTYGVTIDDALKRITVNEDSFLSWKTCLIKGEAQQMLDARGWAWFVT